MALTGLAAAIRLFFAQAVCFAAAGSTSVLRTTGRSLQDVTSTDAGSQVTSIGTACSGCQTAGAHSTCSCGSTHLQRVIELLCFLQGHVMLPSLSVLICVDLRMPSNWPTHVLVLLAEAGGEAAHLPGQSHTRAGGMPDG